MEAAKQDVTGDFFYIEFGFLLLTGWTEWEGVVKKFVPLGICLIAVMQWRAYRHKIRGGTVANQWEVNFYCFLPLRTLSRYWGYLADKKLPEFARPIVYEAYSKTFGVNISEALHQDLTSYPSLADFFARALKEGVRVVDHDSCLVSPCDGTVLSVGTVNNGRVEQVKGVSYYVQDFLGEKVLNSNNNSISIKSENTKDMHEHLLHKPHEGNTLYQCVIYLAPGDYHSAVGATNVGSIKVYFDKTLQTNHQKKTHKFKEHCLGSAIDLHKGDLVGEFRMGSTIVVIFEAPFNFKFNVNHGQKVLMGQCLGTVQHEEKHEEREQLTIATAQP